MTLMMTQVSYNDVTTSYLFLLRPGLAQLQVETCPKEDAQMEDKCIKMSQPNQEHLLARVVHVTQPSTQFGQSTIASIIDNEIICQQINTKGVYRTFKQFQYRHQKIEHDFSKIQKLFGKFLSSNGSSMSYLRLEYILGFLLPIKFLEKILDNFPKKIFIVIFIP